MGRKEIYLIKIIINLFKAEGIIFFLELMYFIGLQGSFNIE